MSNTPEQQPDSTVELLDRVEDLSEEVKDLAMNIALYLAKAKAEGDSEALAKVEPEFIRLVNSTVKTVQEITMILNAARNEETMVYDAPSGKMRVDRIEAKLHGILEQCSRILGSLQQAKDIIA